MEETEFNTKIVVNFIQQLVTECTYRLHSLVQLLQQLVTGYRPGTGYTALYTCFNNWLQSVPTDYRLNSLVQLHCLVHLLQQLVTVCTDRLPASQPYTIASTGYSVPAGDRLHSLIHLFQQLGTSYTTCTEQLASYYRASLPTNQHQESQPKVFYQLATPHQQPIHWPKTDDRPNEV